MVIPIQHKPFVIHNDPGRRINADNSWAIHKMGGAKTKERETKELQMQKKPSLAAKVHEKV